MLASGIGSICYSSISSTNDTLKDDLDNWYRNIAARKVHVAYMNVSGATWVIFGYKLVDTYGIFYRMYYSRSTLDVFYKVIGGTSYLYI